MTKSHLEMYQLLMAELYWILEFYFDATLHDVWLAIQYGC